MPCSFYPEFRVKNEQGTTPRNSLPLWNQLPLQAHKHNGDDLHARCTSGGTSALPWNPGLLSAGVDLSLLRSVFCSFQRGSLASSKDGEILPPAAQHPSAWGGGHYWSEPISPLTTSQQGHSHEDPKKGSPLHLVCPQAARGGPA